MLPIAARSPRRFGDAVGHDGSWSPDGRTIVWANGLDLYVSNSDGTGSRKFLATNAGGATGAGCPTWSPDGKHLRFVLWTSYDFHAIWEVSPDATGLHPLLPGWDNPPSHFNPAWTPDGRYLLFESHKGLTSENIWAIREDVGIFRKAGEPVQLTAGPINFGGPLPSRDGKKIFVNGVEARGELVRYEARSRQFAPYLGGISADLPSFSKDGQWIAYTKYPDGNLWRSKVDGSQQLQLTFSPLQAGMPRWSPDGKRIAFIAETPGIWAWHIYVVSADGGTSAQQLAPTWGEMVDASWSPDGNSLMFGSHPMISPLGSDFRQDRPASATHRGVHILDLRTGQVSTVPGSEGLFSPRWSPDGRYIAAMPLPAVEDTDSSKVVLFDFTTQKWVDLAKIGTGYTNWSRDGKYVYLQSHEDPGIFRVRISDRKLERVVSLKDVPRIWPIEDGFSLTPDDSPLILRNASVEELYALDWDAP